MSTVSQRVSWNNSASTNGSARPEADDRVGEFYEGQVVLRVLLVARLEPAEQVVPPASPFNHPPPGWMAARGGLFIDSCASGRYVHAVAALGQPLSNRFAVVGLVLAGVLLDFGRRRPCDDQRSPCLLMCLGVVHVGSGEHHAKRYPVAVNQDVALCA